MPTPYSSTRRTGSVRSNVRSRGKGAGSVTSQILTTRHALYNVCKAQGREAEAGRLLQGILLELDAARAVTLQRLESWFVLVYLCAFL